MFYKGFRLFEIICLILLIMLFVNYILYEFFKRKKITDFKLKIIFSKNKSTKITIIDCEPKLLGNISIKEASNKTNPFSKNISLLINIKEYNFLKNLKNGGSFKPKKCSRHKLALVIPFKNRTNNLNQFLLNMHPLLQRQHITYTIFVVEQANNQRFNKGIIMNAAYLEIKRIYKNRFDCIMLHDVDLLPLDDLNIYGCPEQRPIHMVSYN